jgi:hypothetical protein
MVVASEEGDTEREAVEDVQVLVAARVVVAMATAPSMATIIMTTTHTLQWRSSFQS